MSGNPTTRPTASVSIDALLIGWAADHAEQHPYCRQDCPLTRLMDAISAVLTEIEFVIGGDGPLTDARLHAAIADALGVTP